MPAACIALKVLSRTQFCHPEQNMPIKTKVGYLVQKLLSSIVCLSDMDLISHTFNGYITH